MLTKKVVICLGLSLALTGLARADELADANALLQKKAYPQALQAYTKLANAGNAEAQAQLGKMYWSGEAGAVDLVKADGWLRKAAAKGNKSAAAALETIRQREQRRADLDYWMTKYDGADLKSGKYRCVAPRIPAISKNNEEITRVASGVDAWQECYNGFVGNLNANSPLSKKMPADVAALMSEQEREATNTRLDEILQRIVADAAIGAKLTLADFAAWRSATEAWVNEHNELVKSSSSSDRSSELDARKNNFQSR